MIHVGNCLEVMPTMQAASVDAIVCDPPYGLGFMGKGWDHAVPGVEFWLEALRVAKPGAYLVAFGGTRTFHRLACAIEDAGWELRDTLMYVYGSGFPKSHNLDRLKGKDFCGCESESTPEREVRPVRNADVPATVDLGERGGQILLPCLSEPGASAAGWAELPGAEVRTEQPGMEGRRDAETPEGQLQGGSIRSGAGMGAADGESGRLHHGAPAGDGADVRVSADAHGGGGSPGPQPGEQPSGEPAAVSDECGPQARGAWPVCAGCGKPRIPAGLGTALKPAWEPIILARKPLDGTVAANVTKHGTGALNIEGCRVGSTVETWPASRSYAPGKYNMGVERNEVTQDAGEAPAGRWPANVLHDGSEEVLAAFPNAQGQSGAVTGNEPTGNGFSGTVYGYGGTATRTPTLPRGDSGSAARFFYCAKADRADRNAGLESFEQRRIGSLNMRSDGHAAANGNLPAERGNHHPTVKPTDLMRWLCRLVTPPGGLVLDPFTGSGSTGRGAIAEGFRFTGIELSPEYAAIAEARIRAMQPGLSFGAADVCDECGGSGLLPDSMGLGMDTPCGRCIGEAA